MISFYLTLYQILFNLLLRFLCFLLISYGRDVENVLATLEDNADPECVALMMEFLSSLVKLKLSALIHLYPSCVKTAMTWVPVEQVCLRFIKSFSLRTDK